VLVNVVRGGPGLGSIAPSQADYFQSTRGGGHGDYYCIVLAPKSVQEAADFTYEAFDLSEKYRIPVIIQADGMIGQMVEALVLPPHKSPEELPGRSWVVGNMKKTPEREARHITSIHIVPEELEAVTRERFKRYDTIKAAETRYEYLGPKAAGGTDITLAAYGTCARVCLGAKQLAEQAGIRVGLFRPITLWPFPYKALGEIAGGNPILTVEMSLGQMVEDVKLATLEIEAGAKRPAVHLLGHSGGVIPTEEEVFAEIKRICK
jgi:2-oxoglutarate ferredoxin oxidoreductase subunit alpha